MSINKGISVNIPNHKLPLLVPIAYKTLQNILHSQKDPAYAVEMQPLLSPKLNLI